MNSMARTKNNAFWPRERPTKSKKKGFSINPVANQSSGESSFHMSRSIRLVNETVPPDFEGRFTSLSLGGDGVTASAISRQFLEQNEKSCPPGAFALQGRRGYSEGRDHERNPVIYFRQNPPKWLYQVWQWARSASISRVKIGARRIAPKKERSCLDSQTRSAGSNPERKDFLIPLDSETPHFEALAWRVRATGSKVNPGRIDILAGYHVEEGAFTRLLIERAADAEEFVSLRRDCFARPQLEILGSHWSDKGKCGDANPRVRIAPLTARRSVPDGQSTNGSDYRQLRQANA